MNTSTDFAKYLTKFLSEYLPHERCASPNTIASYRDTFLQFINYNKTERKLHLEKLKLSDITFDSIRGFLQWIENNRKCGASTRNYRLAAIHSFINYLQYVDIDRLNEWQKILSIKPVKEQKKPMNYLSIDGIKLLLQQPDITYYNGRRHLAILSLMYDTGARVQEICDLSIRSVHIDSKPYTLRIIGKGRKARIVPLMTEQVNILQKYMQENQLDDINKLTQPLFYNSRREKLTRSGVSYILKVYTDLARKENPNLIPQGISCHSLRHSKAMHLLQAGVNLVYIRDILGHTSIQTTEIYARADSKAKREALEKVYKNTMPESASESQWENNKTLLDWLKGL